MDIQDSIRRTATGIAVRLFGLMLATILFLVAFSFAVAAAYMWLDVHVADHAAALILAGVLLLASGLVLLITFAGGRRPEGTRAEAPPSAASEVERITSLLRDLAPAARRRPMRSLLVALAVGVGVGLVLDPRRGDADD